MSDFFRFPHTPHLIWLGEGSPRDDKVLSIQDALQLLQEPVLLEEKVDGANLGLSIGPDGDVRAQNRGRYLQRSFSGQFARLNRWLATHEEALFDALGERWLLFGEWLAAVHSLEYDQLPDYFLVFDVYDRQQACFWSTHRRDKLAQQLGLSVVRSTGQGHYSLDQLIDKVLAGASAYRQGACEGLYLRWENQDRLLQRAKMVHPEFTQGMGSHWHSRLLRWNVLDPGLTAGEISV